MVIFEELENKEGGKREKEVHDKVAALVINSVQKADDIFGQKIVAQNSLLGGITRPR